MEIWKNNREMFAKEEKWLNCGGFWILGEIGNKKMGDFIKIVKIVGKGGIFLRF